MHQYHVYSMASRTRRLYTGVTAALERRVVQHKRGEVAFTAKYRMTRLVLVEPTHSIVAAITREKRIKGWRRAKKLALVDAANPLWADLAEGWDVPMPCRQQQVPPPSSPLRGSSESG